ncbi:MAG: AF1514 family protein [Desulfobulbaceae bacterium]|nr:AF1514 family protein [Desulfobulbaceae bacterium]
MERVEIKVNGCILNYELARKMALAIASENEEDPMLISWNDRVRDKHSPSCMKCEIKGAPGWEVYGRNHGGRLRISVNDDEYVFIYS